MLLIPSIYDAGKSEMPRKNAVPCRLCGRHTKEFFRAKVLLKFDVAYYCCEDCGSLQTEEPYWLDEAYQTGNLIPADAGAVARNLHSQAVVFAVSRILRMPQNTTVLDFGGGNGLLCRLLRDRGFNARVLDAYAINDFAMGFDDNGSNYDIVCAFEVAEHFAKPREQMGLIFERSNSVVIIGTETYEGQGADWWYISAAGGQHVFFYSQKAMASLAAIYGYHHKSVGSVHIFCRRPFTRIESVLLSKVLTSYYLRWVRCYLAYSMSFDCAANDSGLFPQATG
jgi:hypothetical protein